MATMPDP
jgi:hypothetical protein